MAREFLATTRQTHIDRPLIALHIALGLTQRELAARLGESLVSRDERNDYHGITVERSPRILDAPTRRSRPSCTNQRCGSKSASQPVRHCHLQKGQC